MGRYKAIAIIILLIFLVSLIIAFVAGVLHQRQKVEPTNELIIAWGLFNDKRYCDASKIFDKRIPEIGNNIQSGSVRTSTVYIDTQRSALEYPDFPFYAAVTYAILIRDRSESTRGDCLIEDITARRTVKDYIDKAELWSKKLNVPKRLDVLFQQLCRTNASHYEALHRALDQPPQPCGTPTPVPSATLVPTSTGPSPTPSPSPAPTSGNPKITHVTFSPTTLDTGGIVIVNITVRNDSAETLTIQEPRSGFLYEEGESFLSRGYPEREGAFRVGIDFEGRSAIAYSYPYRWGLDSPLAPGQMTIVTGRILLKRVQSQGYWAGLVKESLVKDSKWLDTRQGTQIITVMVRFPRSILFQRLTPLGCSHDEVDFTEILQSSDGNLQINGTATTSDPHNPDPSIAFEFYQLWAKLSTRTDYALIRSFDKPVKDGVLTMTRIGGNDVPTPWDPKKHGFRSDQSIDLLLRVQRKHGQRADCVVRFILP